MCTGTNKYTAGEAVVSLREGVTKLHQIIQKAPVLKKQLNDLITKYGVCNIHNYTTDPDPTSFQMTPPPPRFSVNTKQVHKVHKQHTEDSRLRYLKLFDV